jgi:hypothetical protein
MVSVPCEMVGPPGDRPTTGRERKRCRDGILAQTTAESFFFLMQRTGSKLFG